MVRWIKRIFGSKQAVTGVMPISPETPIEKLQSYESYLRAGCGKVWASWKANDLIAQKVITTPMQVVKRGTSNPVNNKELLQLLATPNPFETFGDLLYKSVFHVKYTGNAYWYKAEQTLAGTKPKALYALNPKRVKVKVDKNQGLIGYQYKVGGAIVDMTPDEVIHFKRPHPDNEWYGIGDFEAAAPMFEAVMNRSRWEDGFWKNGAAPSGLLIYKDKDQVTDQDEWDKMKSKWQADYGGVKNAGKMSWLSGDWSYQRIGLTLADMQDIEKTKLTIENIFQLHGVPLSVAGIREAANFATADIDNQRFKEYTVYPLVMLFVDTLNSDLIQGFDPNAVLQANVSGLVNFGKILLDWVPLFDRGGLTINELREKAGLARDDDNPLWNMAYVNAGLVPLELSGIDNTGATQDQAKAVIRRFIETSAIKP